jgi:hypothetical protein
MESSRLVGSEPNVMSQITGLMVLSLRWHLPSPDAPPGEMFASGIVASRQAWAWNLFWSSPARW